MKNDYRKMFDSDDFIRDEKYYRQVSKKFYSGHINDN